MLVDTAGSQRYDGRVKEDLVVLARLEHIALTWLQSFETTRPFTIHILCKAFLSENIVTLHWRIEGEGLVEGHRLVDRIAYPVPSIDHIDGLAQCIVLIVRQHILISCRHLNLVSLGRLQFLQCTHHSVDRILDGLFRLTGNDFSIRSKGLHGYRLLKVV